MSTRDYPSDDDLSAEERLIIAKVMDETMARWHKANNIPFTGKTYQEKYYEQLNSSKNSPRK